MPFYFYIMHLIAGMNARKGSILLSEMVEGRKPVIIACSDSDRLFIDFHRVVSISFFYLKIVVMFLD